VSDFTLQNDPIKEPRWKPPANEKLRQGVLLSGMDCLPGQEDLFPNMDGPPEREPSK
jgi:hypothetical protein